MYDETMQEQVIIFVEQCFKALAWGYDPKGRHINIKVQSLYKKHGFKQIEKYNINDYADLYFELKVD